MCPSYFVYAFSPKKHKKIENSDEKKILAEAWNSTENSGVYKLDIFTKLAIYYTFVNLINLRPPDGLTWQRNTAFKQQVNTLILMVLICSLCFF